MRIAEAQLGDLLASLQGTAAGNNARRRAHRVPIVARGVVRIVGAGRGQRFSVLTRDISSSGLALIAAAPLDRGALVEIELPAGNGDSIRLAGMVRYCRVMADGLWGVGVEFDMADAEPHKHDMCPDAGDDRHSDRSIQKRAAQ